MSAQPPGQPTEDRTVARLFGVLLMVVGGLIVALSGLCSLSFFVMMAASPSPGAGELATGIGVVLLFGGIPLGVGAGVFLLGRFLWRGPRTVNPQTFD